MKEIWIATHGDKYPGANPGMTPEGFEQIEKLKGLLPCAPTTIVCGTGQRHIDVANALGLRPGRFTAVVGGPESMEFIDRKKVILLADGSRVDGEIYTTLDDMNVALKQLVTSLPHDVVICAGRPAVKMLGKEDAKSAAIYRITVVDDQIENIEEVVAQGAAEEGTV